MSRKKSVFLETITRAGDLREIKLFLYLTNAYAYWSTSLKWICHDDAKPIDLIISRRPLQRRKKQKTNGEKKGRGVFEREEEEE